MKTTFDFLELTIKDEPTNQMVLVGKQRVKEDGRWTKRKANEDVIYDVFLYF